MGLFEFAHMGTFFLDEVEGMSPMLQIKLCVYFRNMK